jgi:hypothetical protein
MNITWTHNILINSYKKNALFNFLILYVAISRTVILTSNNDLLLRWAKQLKKLYVNNRYIPLQSLQSCRQVTKNLPLKPVHDKVVEFRNMKQLHYISLVWCLPNMNLQFKLYGSAHQINWLQALTSCNTKLQMHETSTLFQTQTAKHIHWMSRKLHVVVLTFSVHILPFPYQESQC